MAVISSLINHNNDSRQLRQRYTIWFSGNLNNSNWDTYKTKDPSTIIKISIFEELWKPQEKRKIMDHPRIADQAAKLKNKKIHLDFILKLHMTRLTQIHTNEFFFCSSVFPNNTEILVRQCDIEEDITTSERAFALYPISRIPSYFSSLSAATLLFIF